MFRVHTGSGVLVGKNDFGRILRLMLHPKDGFPGCVSLCWMRRDEEKLLEVDDPMRVQEARDGDKRESRTI